MMGCASFIHDFKVLFNSDGDVRRNAGVSLQQLNCHRAHLVVQADSCVDVRSGQVHVHGRLLGRLQMLQTSSISAGGTAVEYSVELLRRRLIERSRLLARTPTGRGRDPLSMRVG